MAPAMAQVGIKLEPAKKTFVAGEPISVKLTLINNIGKDLAFQSTGRESWLDLHVERSDTAMHLSQTGFPVFPPLMLPNSRQVSKKFDLRNIYSITNEGLYRAQAVVRLPDGRTVGSVPSSFRITPGYKLWDKIASIPNSRQRCHFYVVTARENGKERIYVQVRDPNTGQPYNAACVGTWLRSDLPECYLDGKGSMHMLFQTTPQLLCYVTVDFKGVLKALKYYKKVVARPNMVFLPDGSLRINGAVLHDPFKPVEKVPDATQTPAMD